MRGAGGMVVAPPSITEAGEYTWITDPEHPMAFVPASRFHEFTVYGEVGEAGTHSGLQRKAPEDWRVGVIHDQIMAWAAWLASRGYEQDEVDEALRELVPRVPEPLDLDDTYDDIEKCVGWIYAREKAAA